MENVFLLQKKAVVTNLNDLATVAQEILPNLTSFHLPKRSEKFGRFSRSTLFMCQTNKQLKCNAFSNN